MNTEDGFITVIKPRALVAINEAASANFLRMTRCRRPARNQTSRARGRPEDPIPSPMGCRQLENGCSASEISAEFLISVLAVENKVKIRGNMCFPTES